MTIYEYESGLSAPLRRVTLVFLIKDDMVLLGMKKRGFGVGRWNGMGGKPEPGETIYQTAVRETREEIGVTPKKLKKMARLNFYFPEFPADKNYNQQVWVYLTDSWSGTPGISEEMEPRWFHINDIPFQDMWPDDKLWLPKVLSGSKITAGFMFKELNKISDYYILDTV